jgi:hypothetical protein
MNRINLKNFCERYNLPKEVYNQKWIEITDSQGNLACIHYTQYKLEELLAKELHQFSDKEIETILSIRGVIYDYVNDVIVCQTYPYTYTRKINNEADLDNEVFIGGTFKECFGGSLYRVYKYQGKVYASTHRKIDCSKSYYSNSRKFGDIFLEDQDVFCSLDDIYSYTDGDDDIIHIFLLNSKDLLIDVREEIREDRIIYLKSFSLIDREKDYSFFKTLIERLNLKANKPIHFTKELDKTEVINMLSGGCGKLVNVDFNKPFLDINKEIDSLGIESTFLFYNGKKIIFENKDIICTLLSSSSIFSTKVINNNFVVYRLYCYFYKEYNKGVPIVPYYLSKEDLLSIRRKLERGLDVNINEYFFIKDFENKFDIILTNLFFTLPLHLIDQLFEVHANFADKWLSSLKFFNLHKRELIELIQNNQLSEFKGMNAFSKKAKQYLEDNFNRCFYEHDYKPLESGQVYPSKVIEYYNNLIETNDYININIFHLLYNTDGEMFYTLLYLKEKHAKTVLAHSKSLLNK